MYNPELPKKEISFINSLKRFSKKPIIDDLGKVPNRDLGKSMQGLLGNYLLRQLTPENVDIDLFKRMMNFKLKNNMDIELGQKGKQSLLNFNWRF